MKCLKLNYYLPKVAAFIHNFFVSLKRSYYSNIPFKGISTITMLRGRLISGLRCTLTGFERNCPNGLFLSKNLKNYQIRILSNQINKLRRYTDLATLKPLAHTGLLNPWFVTGFSDGESSFYIGIIKSDKSKLGFYVLPCFQINIHKKDLDLLKSLKSFWGVGKIYTQKESCSYFVNSLKDLTIIVQHFEDYPLITQKLADFKLFKQAIDLISRKEHITLAGLQKIAAIKASLNWGLSEELMIAFPNTIPVQRPLLPHTEGNIPNSCWLVGFTEAEGCFSVILNESPTAKTGFQVQLRFKLTQHIKDEKLIRSLVEFFGCGKVYTYKNTVDFKITKLTDFIDKVLPVFREVSLRGAKAKDWLDFCKAVDILVKKEHFFVFFTGGFK